MPRAKPPRLLRIGGVSADTLSPEDLIPAFLAELDRLKLGAEEWRMKRDISRRFNRADSKEDDLEHLYEILEAHVPEYCYFGSTEGDGADIGCWPDWRSIDDAVADNEMGRGEDLPKAGTVPQLYWLLVNDHGNAMLCAKRGHGRNSWIWKELWSVV